MIYYSVYNSPLGPLYLSGDDDCLTGLSFRKTDIFNSDYKYDIRIFEETSTWLDDYFKGNIPMYLPQWRIENATPFRNHVTEILLQIPYGETVAYNDIAKKIAQERDIKKMSPQAVGNAVSLNPICILIPCHRVIGSNGKLIGYQGGLDIKKSLLKLEKVKLR